MPDLTTESVEALAEGLAGHVLGGDTASEYDAAGQCSCGQKFYEHGGTASAYLAAHRRLLEDHAAHVAQALIDSGVVRLMARDLRAALGGDAGAEG